MIWSEHSVLLPQQPAILAISWFSFDSENPVLCSSLLVSLYALIRILLLSVLIYLSVEFPYGCEILPAFANSLTFIFCNLGEGGDFTCYLCGKGGTLERIPEFSGIEGCASKDGGYKYEELIEVLHSVEKENALRPIKLDNWRLPSRKEMISQSIQGKYLYSIFNNSYTDQSVVGISGTWEQVRGVIQNRYNNKNCKERFVYSLQADSETDIFYVIMVSDFGSEQIIVTFENTYDVVAPKDFKITSCTSAGGKYQLVLTKGAESQLLRLKLCLPR